MSEPYTNTVFQAIADPTRRRILDLLKKHEHPVNSLHEHFDMTQPALSQHLRVLREVGVVSRRRQGRQQIYCLNAVMLKEVYDWVGHYEQFWRGKLNALGEYLDATQDEAS
ncbi:MAG: metalloregulator ArsR/SmtB family transcription factor [Phycisphaerales bacterium]|nr:metalloregulator ArsR/SmtB family transcription factor [Phycisphaerales bacterium]